MTKLKLPWGQPNTLFIIKKAHTKPPTIIKGTDPTPASNTIKPFTPNPSTIYNAYTLTCSSKGPSLQASQSQLENPFFLVSKSRNENDTFQTFHMLLTFCFSLRIHIFATSLLVAINASRTTTRFSFHLLNQTRLTSEYVFTIVVVN